MAAARVVTEDEGQEVFIISAKAQVVRINLQGVKVTNGRYTKGVIVWRDREPDDYVASVACFHESDYTTTGADTNTASNNGSGNGSANIAEMDVEETPTASVNGAHANGTEEMEEEDTTEESEE